MAEPGEVEPDAAVLDNAVADSFFATFKTDLFPIRGRAVQHPPPSLHPR
jgi:hypothetical protein